ncbi:MAG: TRAM domain-containing protein [Desulforudis sp.]|nr:MAG: TRAM domain-containing protein [Desulforudis sp.]
MIRKVAYGFIVLVFIGAGIAAGFFLVGSDYFVRTVSLGLAALSVGLGLALGVVAAPQIINVAVSLTTKTVDSLQKIPLQDLLIASFGLILGLFIANLMGSVLNFLGLVGQVIWIAITIFFGYLGLSVALKKREEIGVFLGNIPWVSKEKGGKGEAKLLDTSAIIDGRIADLCGTGFLEGTLVIPNFVLDELQHIADSNEALRRNRGRRGLDILNYIRRKAEVKVQIYENTKGLEDLPDVDTKLVRLAKRLNAKIITNDFNLNKVAEIQGVKVLNVNELANALKPVVLPGEEMVVQVIRDGKETGQGVGYLDDGTMIVVDGGKRHIGQTVKVIVTSVLQTTAGRMIFAKLKTSKREDYRDVEEVNAVG